MMEIDDTYYVIDLDQQIYFPNKDSSVSCYDLGKLVTFSDGQKYFTLTDTGVEVLLRKYKIGNGIQLIKRSFKYSDLEYITQVVRCIRNIGINNIALYVPYMIGARSDRQFEKHGVNYMKDVIGPALNALNFTKVITLDPHSDVTEACINNLEYVPQSDIFIQLFERKEFSTNIKDKTIIVCPDGGAIKKVKPLEDIGFSVLYCSKSRDVKTGALTKVNIDINSLPDNVISNIEEYSFIIVDDICDGGRTFNNLYDKLLEVFPNIKTVDLFTTHGIYSNGTEGLKMNKIVTTNSIDIWGTELPKVTRFSI